MMDYNDLEYDILKVEEKEVGKKIRSIFSK